MTRLATCLLAAAAVVARPVPACADFLEYAVGDGLVFILQGKATANPGRTVTFKHAKFGNLYFSLYDVKIHPVPTLSQQYERLVAKARLKKDADEMFQAGVWALRHGMLDKHYAAIDKALELDPKHAESLRIRELKTEMDKPLPQSSVEESELRAFVPRPEMRIATSKHFILLYDTPDKPDKEKGQKRPRHEERLELLEQVYESFLLTFFSRGVDLEVPQERLKVVLFNNYADFKDFSVRLDATLINAAGFYMPEVNISFFYDHSTDERFEALQKMNKELEEVKDDLIRARTGGDFIRLANTLKLLTKLAQESQDIEVVSHEATHQLAGNTGLFPRHVRVPSWVHEGLAAYFESPNDGAWSGIGAVNKRRIEYYRALEPDREHSNIDFIVGDQIFDYAGNIGSTLHGYGQAWALTHFLMEKHFDKFITYYRKLGEFPPDMTIAPEMLTSLFNEVFGSDRGPLDGEWRSYMRGLKTDIEQVIGD
ncbi:MAG: DUF1570 domain-containing protein [Pirellulales bacterium]